MSESKVSYLDDGSLVVEYPFNMAVTLETSPHPLLSTEHQLQVKRKVILPGNLVHRLEWRYFLRRDGKTRRSKVIDKVGRRMRVGKVRSGTSARLRHDPAASTDEMHALGMDSSAAGYEGKHLMVCVNVFQLILYPQHTNQAHAGNIHLRLLLCIEITQC